MRWNDNKTGQLFFQAAHLGVGLAKQNGVARARPSIVNEIISIISEIADQQHRQ